MALHVDFLSDTKKVYSGATTKVSLPTDNGMLEILPRHVDFVVNLAPGKVVIYNNGKSVSRTIVGKGVSYKQNEIVTILGQEVEPLK